MASTNKTVYLGLNSWRGTDRPTRNDFVQDNNIIDAEIGEHKGDEDIHFTREEKHKFRHPYFFKILQGNDEETRTVDVDFTPTIVFCFAIDTPQVTYSDGTATVNGGVAISEYGGSGGIIIADKKIKLKQGAAENCTYNLNSSDCQYVIVGLR